MSAANLSARDFYDLLRDWGFETKTESGGHIAMAHPDHHKRVHFRSPKRPSNSGTSWESIKQAAEILGVTPKEFLDGPTKEKPMQEPEPGPEPTGEIKPNPPAKPTFKSNTELVYEYMKARPYQAVTAVDIEKDESALAAEIRLRYRLDPRRVTKFNKLLNNMKRESDKYPGIHSAEWPGSYYYKTPGTSGLVVKPPKHPAQTSAEGKLRRKTLTISGDKEARLTEVDETHGTAETPPPPPRIPISVPEVPDVLLLQRIGNDLNGNPMYVDDQGYAYRVEKITA